VVGLNARHAATVTGQPRTHPAAGEVGGAVDGRSGGELRAVRAVEPKHDAVLENGISMAGSGIAGDRAGHLVEGVVADRVEGPDAAGERTVGWLERRARPPLRHRDVGIPVLIDGSDRRRGAVHHAGDESLERLLPLPGAVVHPPDVTAAAVRHDRHRDPVG
jgi:hypothetical protein